MAERNSYRKISHDDRTAFESLVSDYHLSLHGFVSRIVQDDVVAEDIVQDVFVNLWLNRRKVDFDSPIGSYLYVSARNLAYRHIRSSQRFRTFAQRLEEPGQTVGTYLVEEETARILMNAIERLPPRTAEVLRLSMEGLKQEEIAEKMNVTVANVKLLKARGIVKLREILGPLAFLLVFLIRS